MDTRSRLPLDREARAALPLRRQLLLYLDPFALFMDASRGPAAARRQALAHNRAMRWMLLSYMKRWLIIGGISFLGIAPAEAVASEGALSLLPAAALAAGFCIAAAVTACIAAAYLLLGAGADE